MSLPKKIHYCWFGGGEKNELIKNCIASWSKYCPDCEIIEWNESNYDVSKNIYMKQAYLQKKWGFVSDYARLDIIYEHGGIYLDTDVEIIKNFNILFEGDGFFGFEQPINKKEHVYYVNTGQGFGAKPHNELVFKMLEVYEDLEFVDSEGKLNLCTCPYYNTAVLEKYGLKKNNHLQIIDGMQIYPSEFFCPIVWNSKKKTLSEKTYSIHHFEASWISKKEKRIRRTKRVLDYIIHIPNRVLLNMLGKNKYEIFKEKIKNIK